MIVGLNGRFLATPPTGVQRFAWEIARRLPSRLAARGDRLVLLLPYGAAVPAELASAARVIHGRLGGHAWERLELPRLATRAGCDVVLHPANTVPAAGGPHVVIVHDVEPLVRPRAFARSFAAWYRWAVAPAVRRAARVLTVSEAAAEEIAHAVGLDRAALRVVDQGAAPFDAPAAPDEVADVRSRYRVEDPYLLAVGAADPRKNAPFLRAVLQRWRGRRAAGEALLPPPLLVTVGGGNARVFGRGADGAAALTGELALGRVDDSTLRALYTGALALAFPSTSEGFGRPPLEAMACGAAAVVAPYPAAAEVLGDAAERVPLEVDRWVDALARLAMEPPDARATRVARGRAQAAAHSWESGAASVLEACRSVAAAVSREPALVREALGADRGSASARAAPASPRPTSAGRRGMRVAVVHDWLTGMRGGERVLQEMLEVFPKAELFTLLHIPGTVAPLIEDRRVHTSFIQSLPAAATHYRWYLPLFPRAIEGFDFSGFDLVLSSSHCVAKGARAGRVPHLCYCHTPMRYAWDQFDAYFGRDAAGAPLRVLAGAATRRLREWDRASAARVHRFVANSEHVRARIRAAYGRDASVLHPPVDVDRFQPAATREDFYLVVSALVPYKRVELAVLALAELGRPLVVVGTGPEEARLRALAGPSVRFAGWLPDDEVADLMGWCRALIMPGVEDFGIVPGEAQAAGAPVIALGQGGALETVIARDDDPSGTGVFFREPTVAAVREAVLRSERLDFRVDALRANAERFRPERFREGIAEAVEALLAGEVPQLRPGASSR